jgi:hypothetical protein
VLEAYSLEGVVTGGVVDPRSAFRADDAPLALYKHQEQAIELASQGESYVVTTGTRDIRTARPDGE